MAYRARRKTQARTQERAPTQSEKRDLTEPVDFPESVWDQLMRIGGELSPMRLSAIMRDADVGKPRQLVDTCHDLRQKVGHLQSILQTRELAVASLPWAIQAPDGLGKRAQGRANKIASRLTQALGECSGLQDTFTHSVGESALFSFAYSQVKWDLAADGLLIPTKLEPVQCRRFGFRTTDSKLLFDSTNTGNVDVGGIDLLEAFVPGKFLFIHRRVNGDVPTREGLARVLTWLGSFMTWGLKDWLKFAEMAWKPWRMAKYQKEASQEDINNASEIMRRMTSSGVAVHPETLEIMIEWPKGAVSSGGGNGSHRELLEYLGMEMSKAVLGGTLTVEAGTKGARSLGDVHNEVRRDIRNADALAIAAAIQAFIVEPFVRMNYGPKAEIPIFFFQIDEPLDLKAFSESVKALREAGLQNIPAAWVRDQVGMPQAKPGEEVLASPEASNPDPEGPGSNDDDEDQDQDQDDDEAA